MVLAGLVVWLVCGDSGETSPLRARSSVENVPDVGSIGVSEGLELVWADEFEGVELDLQKWEIMLGTGVEYGVPAGWGNNELQAYTDRPENVAVAEGRLILRAQRRDSSQTGEAGGFTSARLRTKDLGDWTFGRFEIRAKLPSGQGLWPAIWLLPTDADYGGWAASGEIDIMELLGHEPDKVHGTLHYGGGWPDNVHTGTSFSLSEGSFTDDFHVFGLEWEPGELRWTVDGDLYQTQTEWHTEGAAFPAPFDRRFHLLLNVAVGGDWPGAPDDGTTFPQSMEVDYVRVFQQPGPPPPKGD